MAHLTESFGLSLEIGNHADAAQAVSSLAQVHLRCGAPQLAEEQARHALTILDDHVQHCVAGALSSGDRRAATEKTAELLAAVRRFAKTR